MTDITAIILTMNESENIKKCIESIQDITSRVIVIDSGSVDDTVNIAKSLGADVFFHEFENYASQFNWGLDNLSIMTKWTLRIDADERFTSNLCDEVSKAVMEHDDDGVSGFIIKLRNIFLGKFIKHGGAYPFRKLMLFKTGVGRIEDRKMDEHTILSFGQILELKTDALHYDVKDINHWINKHNWYATREMQDYYELNYENSIENLSDDKIKETRRQKKLYYKMPLFFRSFLFFIYRYIFQGGFMDGKEGLIYHFISTYWYRFLVDAKIYEYKKRGGKFLKTGALKS